MQDKPTITAVAVEPPRQPQITNQSAASHDTLEILPEILRTAVIESGRAVAAFDAKAAVHSLGREERLLVEISFGAAFAVTAEYPFEYSDKLVVSVLSESGDYYRSTGLYPARRFL